ncbi:MAG TPA: sigma-70 family RNA polymerase sigma factor [Thermoanaerobaculia bacterium]|nr:sigma-70 family RNA polymerase sigma factor [Thermoanaerobaculia bacterium]
MLVKALVGGEVEPGGTRAEQDLGRFAVRLSVEPFAISGDDFEVLRSRNLPEEGILEAVQLAAFARFLRTLSRGLRLPGAPPPDGAPADGDPSRAAVPGPSGFATGGPWLRTADADPAGLPGASILLDAFGFVPKLYRAQSATPAAFAAEAHAVEALLLSPDGLSRVRRELVVVAVSAALGNTSCFTLHSEALAALGLSEDLCDRIATDCRDAGLDGADVALLEFARALVLEPESATDERLAAAGFPAEAVLEAIAVVAFAVFLHTLQMGLGTPPDFPPKRVFALNPRAAEARLNEDAGGDASRRRPISDPDAPLVARCRSGDVDAFEELVRRHEGRVYRTLLSITGNTADAEDGAQRAFLNAYQRLSRFEGASTFGTWLTRIAINEGLERLRARKPMESLDEPGHDDGRFAPRQIRSWSDDPEQAYVKTELKAIVEKEILKLPASYRVVILLRDVEELSTQEAAAALGVGIPTLKTRLLRGRLMLREALTPYFAASKGRAHLV